MMLAFLIDQIQQRFSADLSPGALPKLKAGARPVLLGETAGDALDGVSC